MADAAEVALKADPAGPPRVRNPHGRTKGSPNARTLRLATASAIMAQRLNDLEMRVALLDGIAACPDVPTAIRNAAARAMARAIAVGTKTAWAEAHGAREQMPRLRAGRDPSRATSAALTRAITPGRSVEQWIRREARKDAAAPPAPPAITLEDVL